MKGCARNAHDLGDRRLGNRFLEQDPDLLLLAVKLGLSVTLQPNPVDLASP
jgi:hypothetical protein